MKHSLLLFLTSAPPQVHLHLSSALAASSKLPKSEKLQIQKLESTKIPFFGLTSKLNLRHFELFYKAC